VLGGVPAAGGGGARSVRDMIADTLVLAAGRDSGSQGDTMSSLGSSMIMAAAISQQPLVGGVLVTGSYDLTVRLWRWGGGMAATTTGGR
jgi:hypothetical protein